MTQTITVKATESPAGASATTTFALEVTNGSSQLLASDPGTTSTASSPSTPAKQKFALGNPSTAHAAAPAIEHANAQAGLVVGGAGTGGLTALLAEPGEPGGATDATAADLVAEKTDPAKLAIISTISHAGGYDAAGRAFQYSSGLFTYTTTFEGRDSYLEKTVSGTSSDSRFQPTTNTLTYDAAGRLLSQREHTTLSSGTLPDRMRYYGNNADGMVQSRRDGRIENGVFVQGDPAHRTIHKAGSARMGLIREGLNDSAQVGIGHFAACIFLSYPYSRSLSCSNCGQTMVTCHSAGGLRQNFP